MQEGKSRREGKESRDRKVFTQKRWEERQEEHQDLEARRIRKKWSRKGGRRINIVILSAPVACRKWGVWRQKLAEKSRKGR